VLDFIVDFIIVFLFLRNRDVLDRDEGPLRVILRVTLVMLAICLAFAVAAFVAAKITGFSN
jgi:hypothetical protein